MEIPYTGSPPACLEICYNKSLVRSLAITSDIPVPLETYLNPNDQIVSLPSLLFPAIVKPNFGDSSIGITQHAVVHNAKELITYIDTLKDTLSGNPILIQEFLQGSEYSVGIIGNPGKFEILPILEVNYNKLPDTLPAILAYEAKWIPDSPYWKDITYQKASLDEESKRKLIHYSTLLFEKLGCRDYARFDFRADSEGTIKLLEVNPNPGWCWDGKLNLMASFKGLSYAELLELILNAARERIPVSK